MRRYVELGRVVLPSLPCYDGDCLQAKGALILNDFSSVLDLGAWRVWQDATLERARLAGQREVMRGGRQGGGSVAATTASSSSSSDAATKIHADALRELLRPNCPRCGLAFMSFSGCVHVTCSVGAGSRVQGCGSSFCGACLRPQPCGSHGNHDFMSPAELHRAWAKWRRERVVTYLTRNFGAPNATSAAVVAATQQHLVAGAIWPLPSPWKA